MIKNLLITLIKSNNFLRKNFLKLYNIIINSEFDSTINNRYPNGLRITLRPVTDKDDYFKNYFLLVDTNFKLYTPPPTARKQKKYKIISTTFNLQEEDFKNSLFCIALQNEERCLKELENIIKHRGYYRGASIEQNYFNDGFSRITSYRFTNTNCLIALNNTLENKDRIAHFNPIDLITHENICEGLELTKNIEGDYVEIGVFKGGSALTALKYLKLSGIKKFAYLLDTFEGFNYLNSKNSLDYSWHNTHFVSKDIMNYIKETLHEFANFKLIKTNIIKDNLSDEIKKISLANIDVDLKEATYEAILKVSKILSINGIIMCEDPVSTPHLYGSLYAMEKFLKSKEGKNKYLKLFKKNHYFLIKIK